MINADAARMLKNIGAEFAQKLAVLIVNLNLVRWRALGDDKIAGRSIDGNTIRIKKLAIALAAFAPAELELTVLQAGKKRLLTGDWLHKNVAKKCALLKT